jgi:hypothetical protein|tara:strand:+ start:242 stop:757 length:516 start_codon:yes stop_codon:yes gene_type:complete
MSKKDNEMEYIEAEQKATAKDDNEINRSARETQTRASVERPVQWRPPSKLHAPSAPSGFAHRWIRAEVLGYEDKNNVHSRLTEGYELVRADEYKDFAYPSVEDGKYTGVIGIGGLLLARIPVELIEQRKKYYAEQSKSQMQAVDNDWMRDNNPAMPKFQAERSSKVTFGSD